MFQPAGVEIVRLTRSSQLIGLHNISSHGEKGRFFEMVRLTRSSQLIGLHNISSHGETERFNERHRSFQRRVFSMPPAHDGGSGFFSYEKRTRLRGNRTELSASGIALPERRRKRSRVADCGSHPARLLSVQRRLRVRFKINRPLSRSDSDWICSRRERKPQA